MRKFVFNTLLAAVLAATVTTTACTGGDPNALETHVKKLDDADARGEAFKELERIVSGIVQDPDDSRRDVFAEKVLPKFEELYDSDEVAPYREQMLDMALKMKRVEALGIWSKAITVDASSGIDGSAEGHKDAKRSARSISSFAGVLVAMGSCLPHVGAFCQALSETFFGKLVLVMKRSPGKWSDTTQRPASHRLCWVLTSEMTLARSLGGSGHLVVLGARAWQEF